jgi:hypothetical protein
MDTVGILFNLSYLVPPTFRWTISPLCVGWNAAIINYMQPSSLSRSINQIKSMQFTRRSVYKQICWRIPFRPCRGNNFDYRLITITIEWVVSNNSNNLIVSGILLPILCYCVLFAQKWQIIAVYRHMEFTATWYSPFHVMFQSHVHHQMQVTLLYE